MPTYNGKPFSATTNLNLKGGILRFGQTNTTNPIGSSDYGLYINGSGQLILSAAGSTTTLGAAGGGGSIPSWEALYNNDQTFSLASSTWTIDRTTGNGDVVTITNTGGGSGSLIQITNAGTGKDIRGDSGTWSVSKVGDAVFNLITASGDAGSDSFTLTAGDVNMGDGSITVVDADNAATFSVTNNTATTASVFVFAGSGTFSGTTTSSFFTITPSGLTTGTAVYLPVAALTTGKAVHVVGNAVTSGILVHIASSAASTQLTGAGRLLKVDHTGNATGTGIVAEVNSAAADETVIFKITASAALALGTAFSVSASALTTGTAVGVADLDSLTDGYGLHVASSATAISSSGHLVFVNHTGNAGVSAVLTEFKSAAADETTIVKINATAALAAGVALDISLAALTTGKAIDISDLDAITTGKAIHVDATGTTHTDGILVHLDSAGTAISSTGRIFLSDHTGATTTSGILNEFKSAANDETVVVKITAASLTSGSALAATGLDALTTGKGLSITSAATAITGAGRLLSVSHTGVTSSSGTLVEFVSSANDGTIVAAITANDLSTGTMLSFGTNIGLTTGTVISAAHTTSVIADGGSMLRLSSTGINTGGATNATMLDIQTTAQVAGTQVLVKAGAVTTGVLLSLISTTGMTSGSLIRATTSTAGAIATNGAISFRATGAYTSASNVGFVDILASATTAGTVLRIASTAAGQTATELLRVDASGFTTGYTGSVATFTSASTTGAANVILVTSANSTDGTAVKVVANSLTTGVGLQVTSSGTITSAGEGLVNLVASGMTTGSALKIDLTEATLTTGKYINCYDDTAGASVFSVGENGAMLYSDFTEVVTEANVITAAESGSVFFLNSATEFASTLPAPVAGMHFTFIVTAAPSGANYTITTDSSANIILGQVNSSTGGNADSEASGADTVNFVDSVAVVGDMAEFWCDGTNWFVQAFCDADGGITITTAS